MMKARAKRTRSECDKDDGEADGGRRPVILSGAMWVGKTRLIDNIIVGDAARLGVLPA